ncbi:DoxX-like protein [Salsuginibacillus halophilus]|uniref:DoxX-like protein n=1 Tax=Salsuginibacillus halophilus TaxID=517424 RepID=A0A2P8HKX5_9BACI|nr:MauE/DoxX family redox-associated membrane protein [Salsuginibacillus halophilus]PSL46871.1 DoxX-like protein [Salsuginibacillus halophilus]
MFKLLGDIFFILLRFGAGVLLFAISMEKLLDITSFRDSLAASAFPEPIAFATPIAEMLVALVMLFGVFVRTAAIISALLAILNVFILPLTDSVFTNVEGLPWILAIVSCMLALKKHHRLAYQVKLQ